MSGAIIIVAESYETRQTRWRFMIQTSPVSETGSPVGGSIIWQGAPQGNCHATAFRPRRIETTLCSAS